MAWRRRSAEHGFPPVRRCAEQGFTPVRHLAEHGFTLVELIVVIAIIGLAAAAVSLAVPDGRGRLADEAALFATRVRAGHDAAIVAARPVSVWVSPGGYGFDQRVGGRWLPMGERGLRVSRWKTGTRANVVAAGGRERIIFDETGLVDRPADLALVRGRYTAHIRIAGNGGVRVDD